MKRKPFVDFIDTYAAAYKRDVFLSAGGFDEKFPVACAEDVDLSFRLARQGYSMVFNPRAWVYHSHPDHIKDYIKKKYKFAYWRVLALCKAPEKILKDSHTPQAMKLQVLLFPVLLLSIFGSILFPWFTLFWTVVYFATTTPFVLKAVQKDAMVGILSPILLFLRSGAQSVGLIGGFIRSRSIKC
jgi:GT2 family glycosyltransferase